MERSTTRQRPYCRQWRAVALSLPTLWSNFRYNVSQLSKRIPIDRLVAYLERSGSCLLDLHFTFSESDLGEGSQALFNSMLENTTSHVDRWRRFSLFSDVEVPMLDFSDRLRQLKAANLEYFTICPNSSELEPPPGFKGLALAPSVFLGGAPKLFYVRVDGTSLQTYFPPFSNVTVLLLEDEKSAWFLESFSFFLEILALPSLSGLSLVGQHFEEPDPPHSSQIIMNNLKHLRYGEVNLIGDFLPFMVAPLLETLIIKGTSLTFSPIPSPLPKFMRPFSNLHSLELIDCTDYDASFINSLVTLTPHVTHLTIVGDSRYQNMLQCISRLFLEDRTKSWQKVKVLTSSRRLDDHPILPYIHFAQMIGNPKLTICTDTREWAYNDQLQESYRSLNAICMLHNLPNRLKIVSWPPSVDVPAEQDFFTIKY